MYAHALQEIGKEKLHQYVGQEPSGHEFNDLVLDQESNCHLKYDYIHSILENLNIS